MYIYFYSLKYCKSQVKFGTHIDAKVHHIV